MFSIKHIQYLHWNLWCINKNLDRFPLRVAGSDEGILCVYVSRLCPFRVPERVHLLRSVQWTAGICIQGQLMTWGERLCISFAVRFRSTQTKTFLQQPANSNWSWQIFFLRGGDTFRFDIFHLCSQTRSHRRSENTINTTKKNSEVVF